MSLLFPVPLGAPSRVRRVSAASRTECIVSLDEPEDGGEQAEDVVVELADVHIAPRKALPEPKHCKSSSYRRGKKLRYKEGKGPKKDRGIVFEVEEHTLIGIRFRGIKGKVFFAEDFEPVS